jgi:hypothetical protein
MALSETETTVNRPTTPTGTGYTGTRRVGEETPGQPGSDIEREARATAGEIKQEMQNLKEEAKQRGKTLVENQREAAAGELRGMVEALRRTAREMDQQDRHTTAGYINRAATTLDRVAGSLRDQDLRSLAGQVQGYARQHPGLFFGGSVLVGFLLARFLKSSAGSAEFGQDYPSGYRPGEYRRTGSRYV